MNSSHTPLITRIKNLTGKKSVRRIGLLAGSVLAFLALMAVAYLLLGRRELEGANRLIPRLLGLRGTSSAQSNLSFDLVTVDANMAGDVKMVGDIDGDGQRDLVVGGKPSEQLKWYHYPSWNKTTIATPNTEFTTDGALGDVDNDNDLDIVVPDGQGGDNLVWFENPLPGGDPFVGGQWTRHDIGAIGSWGKDVELADFDQNGLLDVATRRDSQAMIFFQTAANTWTKMTFSGLTLGQEGLASGDIDKDNDVDLVVRGAWVRNPGGTAARTAGNWTEFNIGTTHQAFKALVIDLDEDNQPDVLFSSSEGTDDVNWWTPTTGDPTGAWSSNLIQSSVEQAHTLQAADMDKDGDLDVVLAQMHTSSAKQIMVITNLNGQATSWQKEVVGTGGLHNGVVADIGGDGDFDIFGSNWTGNPPVRLWENQQGGQLTFTYKEVSSSHTRTFGLAFGDVDRDGFADIISGPFWYRNPDGNLLDSWAQTPLPSGMHAFLTVDVDDDNLTDVIAQQDGNNVIEVYWLEATDATGTTWNSVMIGTVPEASHSLGAQGYRSGQVEAGGKPEVLISSGDGIYYFNIPGNPGSGNWPKVRISSNPSDEGFALADMDNDGDIDVAGTTGQTKQVEWYRNPGNGTADWQAFHIGTFTGVVFPDRVEVADLNDDDRPDIIVSEENGGDSGAETRWWEQPVDPTSPNWTSHLIVTQGTTNSMDAADMDGDQDVDLILGEHRGDEKLSLWLNDGTGDFTELGVSTGKESHLGAQTFDLDGDGDLDIVSIAWDEPQFLHLWQNDGFGGPPPGGGTPAAFLPVIIRDNRSAVLSPSTAPYPVAGHPGAGCAER